MTQTNDDAVLLVGAYERENFGDLLFLLQTQKYLGEIDTVASAPFAADMHEFLTQDVVAFAAAAKARAFDAVWVVGGEVGGTDVANAYRMSATDRDYQQMSRLSPRLRAAHLEDVSGLDARSSPYLPRMSRLAQTHGAAFVINSAGLSGLRRLRGVRRDEAWAAVREASFVSVRDRDSSQLLERHNIEHVLAPDFIHTLPLSLQQPPRQDRIALVQVKANVLTAFGAEALAEVLAGSSSLQDFDIRMFSAGSARGHDSVELYQEVIEHFGRLAPTRRIDMSKAVLPIDKALEIASCGLWVGTSLHGLIISSAYEVPRVALELDKLVRYAKTWDEPMPYGVKLAELDAAVDAALVIADAAASSGRSQDLAAQADSSARRGVEIVSHSRADAPSRSAERLRQSDVLARRRGSLRNRLWSAIER